MKNSNLRQDSNRDRDTRVRKNSCALRCVGHTCTIVQHSEIRQSDRVEAAAARGRVVPRLRRPTNATFPRRAGEHLTPQTWPRPPDHGRTVPTSLHIALVVVLTKEKKYMSQSHLERESVRSGAQARYQYRCRGQVISPRAELLFCGIYLSSGGHSIEIHV